MTYKKGSMIFIAAFVLALGISVNSEASEFEDPAFSEENTSLTTTEETTDTAISTVTEDQNDTAPITASDATAPVLTVKEKNGGRILLNWDETEGVVSYTVYRAKEDSEDFKIIDEEWDDIEYEDNPSLGKIFRYKVEAVYEDGSTLLSNEVTAESYKLTVSTPYATMYKGKSVTPRITFKGAGKVSFESDDPSVAKVSSSGKITGKNYGEAFITASYKNTSIDIEVAVTSITIDVSKWQGNINWNSVKKCNVGAAMLKCTQGTYSKDITFEKNYKGARKAGIKVGVYCFSTAKSVSGAKAEAYYLLKVLGKRSLQYPVVMDFENNSTFSSTSKDVRTKMVLEFKKIIEKAGYDFALYTSSGFLYRYFNVNKFSNVDLWLARYNGGGTYPEYTGPGNIIMWQWGPGKIDGIPGNTDMNYDYNWRH
ncbi:MAG: Ig-like domain-containing protein [Lachnospiraceae bacterium]|nr:Ig-like domain-containing protein [Lachnospiraceae bacterium]